MLSFDRRTALETLLSVPHTVPSLNVIETGDLASTSRPSYLTE